MAGGRRYGSYSPATKLEMWQVGDGTDLIVLLLHSRCGRWETVQILKSCYYTRDVAGGRRYGSYSPATTLEMWQVGHGTDLIVLLLHSRCGRWETVRIL